MNEQESRDRRKALYEKYGDAITPGSLQYPDGWAPLVEDLLALIMVYPVRPLTLPFFATEEEVLNATTFHPTGVRISQIKEKFGGLRVYFSYEPITPPAEWGTRDQLTRSDINAMVRLAERIADRTCVVSGLPGQRYFDGWIRVMTPEENAKYLKERNR